MSVVTVASRASKAHSVEFFEKFSFPAQDVARRLADALGDGAGAGVLASRAHLDAIERELARRLDVPATIAAEQLLLIDADVVFDTVRANAGAREAIVEAMVGRQVRALVERWGRARLYGELVDLFCSAGDREGAIAIEKWWNRQLETLAIELHCGYSVESFHDATAVQAFRHVCDEHDAVIARGTGEREPQRIAAELQQISSILAVEAARRAAVEAAYAGSRASERRTREHLTLLQRVTSALSRAVAYRDIGHVVTGELATALGAAPSMLVVRGELVAVRGVTTPDDPPALASVLDATPAGWYGADDRPAELGWLAAATIAVIPIGPADERVGTVVLGFDRGDLVSTQLIEDLALQLYLAVDRARSYEVAAKERDRAEAANAAKDQFLAMLGHELRNPLSPILTATQLMRLRSPDMLVRERSTIERSVTHMMRLVDDLLDIAKIARGNLTLMRAPIDISEIVAQALDHASAAIESKAHRVHVSVPSGVIVDVDGPRMVQVVANLIGNAAKYTKPGGAIAIGAATRDELVEITVSDNGLGIPPRLLARVFELFVQGPQGSEREPGGLGLGLGIARTITELHGGTIAAASDGPGTGSTFTVTLPQWTRRAPVASEPAHLEPSSTGQRILVVDDNEDAAWLLAEALRLAGHEVMVAHDGIEAIEQARAWSPQIAFLDIGLPGIDGYALCHHLVELPTRPKVVAVTGYGQESDRVRALAAGFDMHLVKPVRLAEVHSAIEAFAKQG